MDLKITSKYLVGVSVAILMALTSCDNGIVGTGEKPKGLAQKGPFLLGSQVLIRERSAAGYGQSAVFHQTISNPLGLFDFEFRNNTFYDIEVSGQFFNEVSGEISDTPVTLTSRYFHKSSASTLNSINVLTHLVSKRIDFLVTNGESPEKAISSANEELKLQFETTMLPQHLEQLDLNHVSLYNFDGSSDTKSNSVLLFISASFMKASTLYPSSPSLQTLIDELANEMEAQGTINNDQISLLDLAAKNLNADQIESNLLDYSKQFPEIQVSVPDIRWCLDNDGDSFRNDIDPDDDGDQIPDAIDPHPYDFEIIPTQRTIDIYRNTTTPLSLDYPANAYQCHASIFDAPTHGSINGLFEYQPNLDFIGVDSFQYEIYCILPHTPSADYLSPPFSVILNIINGPASTSP